MSKQGVADELKFVLADKTRQIEKLEAELLALRSGHQPQERKSMLNNEDLNALINLCIQEIKDLQSQITTLTAERDEAREEIERLWMAVGCATTIKGDMVMRADDPLGMMQEVCTYVAALAAEREVLWKRDLQSIAYKVSLEKHSREVETEREEVVGLLKFAVSPDLKWRISRQLAGKGNWSEETKQKGRRILEIVEGRK